MACLSPFQCAALRKFTSSLEQAGSERIDPYITIRYTPRTVTSLPSYFATSARTVQMGIGCAEWAQSPADKLSEVKYAVRNDTTAIANLICSKDNSSPCARSKTASSRSSSALSCSAGLKNAALRSLPFNLHRARCADSQWANLLAALDFSLYRQSHSCLQSGC